MRILDVLMAFPFLILIVAIMSMLGTGLSNLYIAVGLVGWIRTRALCAARLWSRATSSTCRPANGGLHVPADHAAPCAAERDCPGLVYVFTGMVLAILTGQP